MIRVAALRRLCLGLLAAILLAGVIGAAAPAGQSASVGPAGSAGALPPVPTAPAAAAAASSANGCAGNGSGCVRAGTYPDLNAPIRSDFSGFRVTWASSSVYPSPGKAPALWYAFVTFKNLTSSSKTFACSADWPASASAVVEVISGGGGNDKTVTSAGTSCSDDGSLTRTVPPGQVFTAYLAFETVPWPANKVAIRLGGIGASSPRSPFAAPSLVTACQYLSEAPCQSLRPTVTEELYNEGGLSGCDFSWDVSWGDGTRSDGLRQDGPPAGYVVLTRHRYRKAGAFTITLTGTVTSGNCTVRDGADHFTLLGYAALGDSYSAGVGAGDYFSPDKPCWRSRHAYSAGIEQKLAIDVASPSASFLFVACNGAQMSAFENSQEFGVLPQFEDLQIYGSRSFGLVTFSIGGNDVGFADVMGYCARRLPGQETCQKKFQQEVNNGLQKIAKDLPGDIKTLQESPALAPGARILVVGYPELFDPAWFRPKAKTPTCGTGVPGFTFAPSDMKWLNSIGGQIDGELKAIAASVRATYVSDLTAYQGGHYLCEKSPDVNAVTLNLFMSYHPKAAGQAVMASDAEKALGLG